MREKVNLSDVLLETLDKLDGDGILLVAGDPPNPMTIGWGTIGHIWNNAGPYTGTFSTMRHWTRQYLKNIIHRKIFTWSIMGRYLGYTKSYNAPYPIKSTGRRTLIFFETFNLSSVKNFGRQ